MVSVWGEECQECKSQKSKLILFNDILLNEISDDNNRYLCCNDCSKMLKVINDPIYKTLKEEQQMIFKFVRLFPFPKNIKALKREFRFIYWARPDLERPDLNKLNKHIFSIIKHIYENLFKNWDKEKDLLKNFLERTVEEMNKHNGYDRDFKTTAFLYILNIINNLMALYKEQSKWGTSRVYDYPSCRKYIRFSMGDRFSLNYIIQDNLTKGLINI